MTVKLLIRGFLTGCLLVVAAHCPVLGQDGSIYIASESEKTEAVTLLNQLSEGVLIVRLNSNNRKMKELERLIMSPDVNDKSKKRFQKMLETTREETEQENLDIIKSFDGNYNFSNVLFMYDTASLLLKDGVKSGYFLNRKLEADPTIRLESDNWLMVYFRHESPALFVLLDQQLEQVRRPFPIPKRPVFKSYNQGMYFSKDPQTQRWDIDQPDTASGFVLFMSFNRKKQFKYFSILINAWNRDLQKALNRISKEGQ